MSPPKEDLFATYKNLLFFPNPTAQLNCVQIFGYNIFKQAKLRARFVQEGGPSCDMLRARGFTLLDAQGDDGTLTSWMMQQGFTLPCDGNALALPSPSFLATPFTFKQIEAWLLGEPSLVEKTVFWKEEHEDHSMSYASPFPSYVDLLCQKRKVVDMSGQAISRQEEQELQQMMLEAKSRFEKHIISQEIKDTKPQKDMKSKVM